SSRRSSAETAEPLRTRRTTRRPCASCGHGQPAPLDRLRANPKRPRPPPSGRTRSATGARKDAPPSTGAGRSSARPPELQERLVVIAGPVGRSIAADDDALGSAVDTLDVGIDVPLGVADRVAAWGRARQ